MSPFNRVVFGTKGGRPRETVILDVVAIRKALDNALVVAEDRHGRLIDKSDLKTAMKYWHSQASRLGLTGTYSPHSLRYAWAQDAIRHYLAQGFCEGSAGNDGDGFGSTATGAGGMWRRFTEEEIDWQKNSFQLVRYDY